VAHRAIGPLAGMPHDCGSRHAFTQVDEEFEMNDQDATVELIPDLVSGMAVEFTADVEFWGAHGLHGRSDRTPGSDSPLRGGPALCGSQARPARRTHRIGRPEALDIR
jgi:hypothetical protein